VALKVSTVYKETIPTISSAIVIVSKGSVYLNDQTTRLENDFLTTF